MTTVPGHNIVLQQSGAAQELAHQAHSPKPSPEQAAAQQAAGERLKNTTVQEFDELEKLKADKERLKRRQELKAVKKKRKQEEMEQDPDAPGRLLDTMA